MSRRVSKEKSLGGKLDDFPTPSWCVDRLLDEVDLPRGHWLEPSAGSGAIIRAVNNRRSDIHWTSCELQEKYHESLDRVSVVHIGDFLRGVDNAAAEPAAGGRWKYDVVIGNPPYSLAEQFIARCRLLAPLVVFLLRLNYVGSERRAALHRVDMPERIWGLPNRPVFRGVSGDSCEYGWFIWGADKTPECRLRMLRSTPVAERRRK